MAREGAGVAVFLEDGQRAIEGVSAVGVFVEVLVAEGLEAEGPSIGHGVVVLVDEGEELVGILQDLFGGGVGPELAAKGADAVFDARDVVVGVVQFIEDLAAPVKGGLAGGDVAELSEAVLFLEQRGEGVVEIAGLDEVSGAAGGAVFAAVGIEFLEHASAASVVLLPASALTGADFDGVDKEAMGKGDGARSALKKAPRGEEFQEVAQGGFVDVIAEGEPLDGGEVAAEGGGQFEGAA